jgi:predicted nucleic acid-binding protein
MPELWVLESEHESNTKSNNQVSSEYNQKFYDRFILQGKLKNSQGAIIQSKSMSESLAIDVNAKEKKMY